jgi:hypothetical protein
VQARPREAKLCPQGENLAIDTLHMGNIATPPGINLHELRRDPQDALRHTRVMVKPVKVPVANREGEVKKTDEVYHTASTAYKGLFGGVDIVIQGKEEVVLKMDNGHTVTLPIEAITAM